MKLRPITRNKKGEFSQFNLFSFIIISFLFVVFSAGLIYVMGLLNNVFTEVGVINEQNVGSPLYVNMTLASEQIWGKAYESIQALRIVSITYILALAISLVIIGSLERKHPFLFFVWILISLLGIIFSPMVSNAYENLLKSNIFGGELTNFTASNVLLLNLPVVVMIISILGGIFLFINLVRTGSEEDLG